MKEWRIDMLRENYPVGTMLELHDMSGESQMPSGLKGKIFFVDDIGQIHVDWENGSNLALVPGEDSFSKIAEPEQNENKYDDGMEMNM